MTAYFGGMLAQADFRKVPSFAKWLAKMTRKPRPASNAEIAAFFGALAQNSKKDR